MTRRGDIEQAIDIMEAFLRYPNYAVSRILIGIAGVPYPKGRVLITKLEKAEFLERVSGKPKKGGMLPKRAPVERFSVTLKGREFLHDWQELDRQFKIQ